MSKTILLLLLVAASALSAASQSGRRIAGARSAPAAPVQPPANPEPEFKLKTVNVSGPLLFLPVSLRERQIKALDDSSFRLDDFYGKVVVINLWASWCGPCRREIPEYEKVRKAYAERGVEFIGLTTEDPITSTARVRKFVRDVSFGFRLGWADADTARILMNGRNGVPQTLVIDADGRVVKHWTGFSRREGGDKLKQVLDHALQTAQ